MRYNSYWRLGVMVRFVVAVWSVYLGIYLLLNFDYFATFLSAKAAYSAVAVFLLLGTGNIIQTLQVFIKSKNDQEQE